jgi:Uma2 family endonuclease
MATAIRQLTADDLFKIPDDGFRYELVKGILRKMTPAGKKHGKIAIRIGGSLEQYVRSHTLGEVYAAETGFKIGNNPDTVRAPDVAFVVKKRVEVIGDIDGYIPGAPDLAVEVVSPGDSFAEVEEKVFDWLEAGSRMVVVANPSKKTLTIYRSRTNIKVLTEADVLDGSDVVHGWTLILKGLFD